MSALAIRFQRHGRKHYPFYRIVVAPKRARRDGKFVEILGTFDPHLDRVGLKNMRLNVERMRFWLATGAQPSMPVARVCARFNLLPPPPLRIGVKYDHVKPELLPRPFLQRQPLPQDRPERY